MNKIIIPKNILSKYAGKRVAIVDGKVVAASSNAKASFEKAKEKYPKREILIYHVPKKEERYHLYNLCVSHTKMVSLK